MNTSSINKHFAGLDLDIRKSRNGRFMDQKLTHDNLSFIADCILNLVNTDSSKKFTTRDLWDSDYFRRQVVFVYNKPDPHTRAKNEYDKFIGQPLKLLSYAGILDEQQEGKGYTYTINKLDLLEFIALNSLNAFTFLALYLTKVLSDSDEIKYFNAFEKHYHNGNITNEDLIELRAQYARFIQDNTPINGDFEPNRIFNKILNILAIYRRMPGAQRGRITDYPMILKDLEYNAVNWRDIAKKKNITRKEALQLRKIDAHFEKVSEYEMAKAKQAISRRHHAVSEVSDELSTGAATQVHHIFPVSRKPEYKATLENLILLTPSQHYAKAHPNNNTQIADKAYQKVCLLAKLNSIVESINAGDAFYSLTSFTDLINNSLRGVSIPQNANIADIKHLLNSYSTELE